MFRRKSRIALFRPALLTLVLALGLAAHARAQGGCDNDCFGPITPEIDPSLGSGGLALVGGAILLVRSRRTR
jgi:hypothetical protein